MPTVTLDTVNTAAAVTGAVAGASAATAQILPATDRGVHNYEEGKQQQQGGGKLGDSMDIANAQLDHPAYPALDRKKKEANNAVKAKRELESTCGAEEAHIAANKASSATLATNVLTHATSTRSTAASDRVDAKLKKAEKTLDIATSAGHSGGATGSSGTSTSSGQSGASQPGNGSSTSGSLPPAPAYRGSLPPPATQSSRAGRR